MNILLITLCCLVLLVSVYMKQIRHSTKPKQYEDQTLTHTPLRGPITTPRHVNQSNFDSLYILQNPRFLIFFMCLSQGPVDLVQGLVCLFACFLLLHET